MGERVFTGRVPVVGEGGREGGAPPPVPVPGQAGSADPVPPREGIVQPVLLLADSQLLFWARGGELFLERLRERVEAEHPRAAYLGASNGDDPQFYELFEAAMHGVGITRCRMVPAAPSPDDLAFLEEADLVLLAGGDVERGWKAFVESGVRDVLLRRYFEGAVLIGVSAGAVQLGLLGRPEGDASPAAAFPTLGLVPYVVDAHDEERDWEALRDMVAAREGTYRGLGIPRGGGVIYHPDHRIEPVRHPACELVWERGEVAMALLFPVAEG